MFVYLLESLTQKTYVGATVNLERRLRQHNRELKGGAKATSHDTWERVCYVSHFPDWSSTLQFEWRWKQLSRKQKGKPMEKRIQALHQLLALDRSTSKAIPFCEWDQLPAVTWENKNEFES